MTEKTAIILQEYQALRNEILKRIEFRNNFFYYGIVLSGAFFGITQIDSIDYTIILFYPFLNFFLVSAWVHEDLRIHEIGNYLKTSIEQEVKFIKFESYLFELNEKKEAKFKLLPEFSAKWFFLIMDIVFMGIALFGFKNLQENSIEFGPYIFVFFLTMGFCSLFLKINLLGRRRKIYDEHKKESNQIKEETT